MARMNILDKTASWIILLAALNLGLDAFTGKNIIDSFYIYAPTIYKVVGGAGLYFLFRMMGGFK